MQVLSNPQKIICFLLQLGGVCVSNRRPEGRQNLAPAVEEPLPSPPCWHVRMLAKLQTTVARPILSRGHSEVGVTCGMRNEKPMIVLSASSRRRRNYFYYYKRSNFTCIWSSLMNSSYVLHVQNMYVKIYSSSPSHGPIWAFGALPKGTSESARRVPQNTLYALAHSGAWTENAPLLSDSRIKPSLRSCMFPPRNPREGKNRCKKNAKG